MRRELGIARCGLACCLCSEGKAAAAVTPVPAAPPPSAKNLRCSRDRQLAGCYACNEDCRKGLLQKIKPRGFCEFIRRYGMEALLDRLEANEAAGVVYHRQGITGDYDHVDDMEALIALILTGRRQPAASGGEG